MPQISTVFHAQRCLIPKGLPEWNKTKFETISRNSTFSSQTWAVKVLDSKTLAKWNKTKFETIFSFPLISSQIAWFQNACQSEIRLNLKQCLRFPLFHHKHAQSAPKRLPEWNKTKFETMPQISTFSSQTCSKCSRNACQSEIRLNLKQCLRFPLFHHKDAQSAPKRLPEWNKTKFETMPQISTFSSQTCSKCSKTLARVK